MKVKDEVQYDIFRRVLASIVTSSPELSNADAVDDATKLTDCAVKRLVELGIVE